MTKFEAIDEISPRDPGEAPVGTVARAAAGRENHGTQRPPVLETRAANGTPIKVFGATSTIARGG